MRSGRRRRRVEACAEATCPSVASISGSPLREALASRASDGQDGEALLDVAAVGLDMQAGDGLDGGPARRIEVPERDEVVGQGSGLVARPGVEGGDERALVDQAVLEGQQAEEQVAVGSDWGHGVSLPNLPERPAGASATTACSSPSHELNR